MHATLRLSHEVGQLRTKKKLRVLKEAFRAQLEGADFRLVHFSVQSGHLHLIVEAKDKRSLARGMQALEIRLARRLNTIAERKGRVFTDRYHARALETPREVRAALAYVLLNSRHHARDAKAKAWIDPCSSGVVFDGWSRPCSLPPGYVDDDRPRATSAPRTWLLKFGWRKRGLISPDEVPGGG